MTLSVEQQVQAWVSARDTHRTRQERTDASRLRAIVSDPDATAFVAAFLDRTVRPESATVQAQQLVNVTHELPTGAFLGTLDRLMLSIGARLAPLLPSIVMPLANWRLRSLVGHLVAPADPEKLAAHMAKTATDGQLLNVNRLGEAVLGPAEASHRFAELVAMLTQPGIDYVSVKLSAVVGRLPVWDHGRSVTLLANRLGTLLDRAAGTEPATFVNVDMEAYHELDVTIDAFRLALDAPARRAHSAGIVLQTYLPEALARLQSLAAWANERHANGGGLIKVRLVKGANLAMEAVESEIHGWELPAYTRKLDTDANFKRCIDWAATPDRLQGLRLGIASHNLFDIAWARELTQSRGVADHVQFEMLQGMSPGFSRQVAKVADGGLVLYTPAVGASDFDVALSYLFRRLEENASTDNFMRHVDELAEPAVFARLESAFRASLANWDDVATTSPRLQDRSTETPQERFDAETYVFANEPDTDPALQANRAWMLETSTRGIAELVTPELTSIEQVDAELAELRSAPDRWTERSALDRANVLLRCADELRLARGDLIATMIIEANKTAAQADVEISEAIDFARYYAVEARDLARLEAETLELTSTPFGVVCVASPWNFPVAIACGGVFGALAAGNTVALKPSPHTPRCAELIVEACRRAGVSDQTLRLVRAPDGDIGTHLVTTADAVIMTGSSATADRFLQWKPDMRLFAETSGKNALIITPAADIDQAVADLVASAFGHSGQKCSAASLGILVGDIARSERFQRQLIDAVSGLHVGRSDDLATDVNPLIGEANPRLAQALAAPRDGASWLVEPRLIGATTHLWSPGVLTGVEPGSWFHRTECFGPVLGLIAVDTLDDAIEAANATEFGLTGGIHSLDPSECSQWLDRIAVGNAYINRSITGAIVQRQPFGGWKRSAVGPGAKAGGPNYVAQLTNWSWTGPSTADTDDFAAQWVDHFSLNHDPAGLVTESNVFRYRPLSGVLLRTDAGAPPDQVDCVRRAAQVCAVPLVESDDTTEPEAALIARLGSLVEQGIERIRFVGKASCSAALRAAAADHGLYVDGRAPLPIGRLELVRYLREQSISQTMHRHGSTLGQKPSVGEPTHADHVPMLS